MGAPTDSDRVIAGRYRLIEHLGSGGMGTVWLARDELLRRRVAVKEVFPPAGLSDSEREMLRERTLQEARTAARLSHPNVVTIYDVAEDDGRPWIVMELIQARSLGELVDENGPLDVRAAARVGLQLLAALRSAHAIGVMHRDVKPGNVLMDADGRAILADFGIARAEDSPATTTSGVLVGSPSYIAPERAQGGRGGPASDLWSLGATLYAAVEGRPPYDRAGALPTLMAVVSEDPDPPRRAGIMWPVISGLLAADPSRRLSAAAAEQMLRQVAESGAAPVTAPMPAADQLAGSDVTRAGRGKSPDTLKRAERTRAFHPRASPGPEPPSGSLQPSEPFQPSASPQPLEPPEPLRPHAPAEPAAAQQRPEAPVPSRAETDQDTAVTPRTGFPVLPGSFPAETEPSAAPGQPAAVEQALPAGPRQPAGVEPIPAATAGQPAADAGQSAASPQASVVTAAQPAEDADKDEDPADEPVLVPAGTEDAPAPATPVRGVPAPARWENGAPEPRPRRIRLLASAVALVAAAGVALGLYVANRPAAGPSASGRPGHSASAPARSQAATPGTPRARTQPVTATSPQARSAPPTAKTSARPDSGDQAIVPAGYHRYRDPTGFSIAIPNGWKVSHQGHYVYLTPPSGASFLLIDQSDRPQPNPLADWQQQEANRRATYVGYHRIRLVAIHYPQAEKAADWEFTYYRNAVLIHVLNRNVLANAQHAYALYWSTPASEWSSDYPIFAVLARTFQPASRAAS
jgi:serine/threonine protein kinase